MAHREAVAAAPPPRFRGARYWARPVPSLGSASARLLVVGLAPAAHGGNRTGRMFTGDAAGGSGEWVARALNTHGFASQPTSRHRGDGFRLIDAYITAAIHCAPPGNRPLPSELKNCAGYLEAELRLLPRVRVVIALGRIGYDAYLRGITALGLVSSRPRPSFRHGVATELSSGVTLLASYHPSRQNTQTGKLTWRMFDAVVAEARRRLGPPRSIEMHSEGGCAPLPNLPPGGCAAKGRARNGTLTARGRERGGSETMREGSRRQATLRRFAERP